MPTLTRSADIDAPAERVFAYVDDIRNLARHMSEHSSMPMMGSRLTLDIVSPMSTGLGATYHYSGRVLGFVIDFSEVVTTYVQGREKVWHTIGRPRLLIIDQYTMRLLVEPVREVTCRLTIALDYELSKSIGWGAIGSLLAPLYARWCVDSMIQGTVRDMRRR